MFSMYWFTLWMIDHYCWPYKMEEQVCYYYRCHSKWSSLWEYESNRKRTFLTDVMGLENKSKNPTRQHGNMSGHTDFGAGSTGIDGVISSWRFQQFVAYSPRRLGKWSNLTNIFSKGVGTWGMQGCFAFQQVIDRVCVCIMPCLLHGLKHH